MFPKKVKIQNQTWSIEYCDVRQKANDDHIRFIGDIDSDEVMGYCDVTKREICVDDDMCEAAQVEVLLHEIGHGFFNVLPHNIPSEYDENFAKMFATAVLDLCINNKLDWIKK
jgi:hypothetical protein